MSHFKGTKEHGLSQQNAYCIYAPGINLHSFFAKNNIPSFVAPLFLAKAKSTNWLWKDVVLS